MDDTKLVAKNEKEMETLTHKKIILREYRDWDGTYKNVPCS